MGDMMWLNMSEAPHRCGWKYLLWLVEATAQFPLASYYLTADDDTYLLPDRVAADLRSFDEIDGRARASHSLWGLLMWKAYYNHATLNPATGYTGWEALDWNAVAQRRAMTACAKTLRGLPRSQLAALQTELDRAVASGHVGHRRRGGLAPPRGACAILRHDHFVAVATGQVGELPPFPMAVGFLFGVSRPMAGALVASRIPRRWQERLERAPLANRYLPGIPCYPAGDSIFGFWLSAVALEARINVTLIDTPAHHQQHPFLSWRLFTNRSLVMHGFKNQRSDKFRAHAAQVGKRRFEPFARECDTCQQMGWVTWPKSTPMAAWRCCGARRRLGGRRYKACRSARANDRSCPKMAASSLIELSNTFE